MCWDRQTWSDLCGRHSAHHGRPSEAPLLPVSKADAKELLTRDEAMAGAAKLQAGPFGRRHRARLHMGSAVPPRWTFHGRTLAGSVIQVAQRLSLKITYYLSLAPDSTAVDTPDVR